MVKYKVATGIMKMVLVVGNALAVSTPWKTIYFRNNKIMNDKKVRKHELIHQEQYKRDGIIIFGIKYIYYFITKTRYNNPYEKEAWKAVGIHSKEQHKAYTKRLRKLAKIRD